MRKIQLIGIFLLQACSTESASGRTQDFGVSSDPAALVDGGVRSNAIRSAEVGPPATVAFRAPGQLAVSWPGNPNATSYVVFQSQDGGTLGPIATVFDAAGGPPATSYIAADLPLGARFCFALQSVFSDSSTSSPGTQSCSTTQGLAASIVRTFKINALSGVMSGFGAPQVKNGLLTGNWTVFDGDMLAIPLPVRDGQIFQSVAATVFSSSASRITMSLMAQDDAAHLPIDLGDASTTPRDVQQTLPVTSTEQVDASLRSYFLQFRVSRSSTDTGQPLIGPIYLVMLENN